MLNLSAVHVLPPSAVTRSPDAPVVPLASIGFGSALSMILLVSMYEYAGTEPQAATWHSTAAPQP